MVLTVKFELNDINEKPLWAKMVSQHMILGIFDDIIVIK